MSNDKKGFSSLLLCLCHSFHLFLQIYTFACLNLLLHFFIFFFFFFISFFFLLLLLLLFFFFFFFYPTDAPRQAEVAAAPHKA